MTTTEEKTTVVFFGPLTVPLPGPGYPARVMTYGDEIEVTDELREAGTDRVGNCWLDLIDDPDGQRARWGEVLFTRGPWAAEVPRIKPGSIEWHEERDLRRAEAWSIKDERERGERLSLINEVYGVPTTSTTLRHYDSPSEG